MVWGHPVWSNTKLFPVFFLKASLRCSISKFSCDDSKLLKRHKLEKHGVTDEKLKKPFSCDVCECSYASKTALNYHTMRKKKKHTIATCVNKISPVKWHSKDIL